MANRANSGKQRNPSDDLKFTFEENGIVQIRFPKGSADYVAKLADELYETAEDYNFAGVDLTLRERQPRITLQSTVERDVEPPQRNARRCL